MTHNMLHMFRSLLLDTGRRILLEGINTSESRALHEALQAQGMLRASREPDALADDVRAEDLDSDYAVLEPTIFGEINAALERLDNGTYGICQATGRPIEAEALRSQPWRRYCAAYCQGCGEFGEHACPLSNQHAHADVPAKMSGPPGQP